MTNHEKARALRKAGLDYDTIARRLGLRRATVAYYGGNAAPGEVGAPRRDLTAGQLAFALALPPYAIP